MKTKLNIRLPYLLSIFALGGVIFFGLKTQKLQKQLKADKADKALMAGKIQKYEGLLNIDSLLVDGSYTDAFSAYKQQVPTFGENDKTMLELRMAMAQKMAHLKNQLLADSFQTAQAQAIDTNETRLATPNEIKQYDSLSFALEKSKAQLSRMRRLLQQKSFGEYLTFSNNKGSQMHYVGQVKDNKANGHGVAILSTGSRYEGEWKNNRRHGEGTFYWADGEYYIGQYKNDKRSGHGTYYWSNGEKFVGLWENDRRTGEGTFYAKDGKVVASGLWQNDELVAANKP